MSAQAQPAAPLLNGGGEGDLPRPSGEVETAASCSGLGQNPRSEQMQTMEAGGGSERRSGDVTMETAMPQPAEATAEQYIGAQEANPADPLLFGIKVPRRIDQPSWRKRERIS